MQKKEHDKLGQRMSVALTESRILEGDPFMQAPLHIGSELFVEINSCGQKHRIRTNIVGYRRGDFILINTPKVESLKLNPQDKKNVVIRYFLDGNVYGFQAQVIRTLGYPLFIDAIEYPDRIEEVTLRKAQRIQVVIPFNREGGDPEKEVISNISETGALLNLNEPMMIDNSFNISFTLPSGDFIEEMPVTVRRVEVTREKILAGIEFDKNHGGFEAVGKYIATYLMNVQ